MPNTMIDCNVNETTAFLSRIIRRRYEESPRGSLKGYLVLDELRGVIPKEERKYFASYSTQGNLTPCHGSVKCSETDWLTQSLTAMIIAYSVKSNLMEIFKDHPFKKFTLEIETYPKYTYEKFRITRYQKTGDDISFLKADIEW